MVRQTPRLRAVLAKADTLHAPARPEELLLALLDEGGMGRRILAALNVDLDALRDDVESRVRTGEGLTKFDAPTVLETVEHESHGWAGTHHLVLALRQHRVGGLAGHGVKAKDVFNEIGRQFDLLYREHGAINVTVDNAD